LGHLEIDDNEVDQILYNDQLFTLWKGWDLFITTDKSKCKRHINYSSI